MFRAMKISRSAYYAWAVRAKASGSNEKEARVRTAVKEKFYSQAMLRSEANL